MIITINENIEMKCLYYLMSLEPNLNSFLFARELKANLLYPGFTQRMYLRACCQQKHCGQAMCEGERGVNQTGGRRVAGWLQPENQNNVAVSSKASACGESCIV